MHRTFRSCRFPLQTINRIIITKCLKSSDIFCKSFSTKIPNSLLHNGLPVWENPCGKELKLNLSPEAAEKMYTSTNATIEFINYFKDHFAREKIDLNSNFSECIENTIEEPSVLVAPWFKVESVSEDFPDNYYEYCCLNLPAMCKYLELVVGSMWKINSCGNFASDEKEVFALNMDILRVKIKSLLCDFHKSLYASNIRKLKSLDPSELPQPPSEGENEMLVQKHEFLIFRDSYNFIDIMNAFFGRANLKNNEHGNNA